MPNTETAPCPTLPSTGASTPLELRLHGGSELDLLIPIPVGKLSVGSGPRCALRLPYDGVQPLHCLITRDGELLRVRRWADPLLLNGLPLDEATLVVGDRLAIGSVELEVVGPPAPDCVETQPADEHLANEGDQPTDESQAAPDVPQDEQPLPPIFSESIEAIPTTEVSPESSIDQSTDSERAAMPGVANHLTRGRRRKLISALRFHHQMGMQLERSVANLEQQMREVSVGQANSMADGALLNSTLSALVDQVRDYRREQGVLEKQYADWQEESRRWMSRWEDQQQSLNDCRVEAQQSRAIGDSLRRRGRKLVAGLRKGRESFQSLEQRLASLEQKTLDTSAEWSRLRDEVSTVAAQQNTQETQAVAWNTVVEATDRLTNNYRQLVAENTRLAGEIEKLAKTRGELAAEKTAAAEMLGLLREQHRQQQQRQAEFEQQHKQWHNELRAWEARVSVRDQWAENFERELKAVRSAADEPKVPIAEWKSLAEEVASLSRQQSEVIRLRGNWEGRVAEWEAQIADRGERLTAIEQGIQQLQAAAQEQADRFSGWSELAQQVDSLASQQAVSEQDRTAIRKLLDEWESRFAGGIQQWTNCERQLQELQAACREQASQATLGASLSEELAKLRNQQAEWEQSRGDWQARVEQSDRQFVDLHKLLGTVEQDVAELRVRSNQPTVPLADWTALSAEVAGIRASLGSVEQDVAGLYAITAQPSTPVADWESLAKEVAGVQTRLGELETSSNDGQGRVSSCNAEVAAIQAKLAETDTTVADLQAISRESVVRAAEWAATNEQVVTLRAQQAEIVQQQAEWDEKLNSWQAQLATGTRCIGDFQDELEGLRAAHRDQATQVTELTSLVEQLAGLQRQQADFDQSRAQWQERATEWESQLRQKLQRFESFEQELQKLHEIQRHQVALVAGLASRALDRPAEQSSAAPSVQIAAEHSPTDVDRLETGNDRQIEESFDAAEQFVAPQSIAESATSDANAWDATTPEASDELPEAEPPAAAPQVSYLQRYAHLFDDEAVESPQSTSATSTLQETMPSNRAESNFDRTATVEHHAGHGDEESVEQYMAKLLKRIRGESSKSTDPQGFESLDDDDRQPASAAEFVDSDFVSASDPTSMVTIVDEGPNGSLLNDLEELRPKSPPPQFAADMRALRALANQSARHAIGVHTARKLRRNTLTRCVISVLAISTGLYLTVYAPSWTSVQFGSACVALVAAFYWTKLTISSLMRAIQVGAFQHFSDDEDDDPLHPPLPIDVER